jgi:hypothetical protein
MEYEFRWVRRIFPFPDHGTYENTTLQVRHLLGERPSRMIWSEWKDVPVVTEASELRRGEAAAEPAPRRNERATMSNKQDTITKINNLWFNNDYKIDNLYFEVAGEDLKHNDLVIMEQGSCRKCKKTDYDKNVYLVADKYVRKGKVARLIGHDTVIHI